MLKTSGLAFYLFCSSIALTLFVTALILLVRRKKQVHYAFLLINVCTIEWGLCRLIQLFHQDDARLLRFLEDAMFVGVIVATVGVFYLGLAFAKTRIEFTPKHLLVLVIPAISIGMVVTNGHHHLFLQKYSLLSDQCVYGDYFVVHNVYSYGLLAIGFFYLLRFSIKNSGFFSRQSLLILLGMAIPAVFVFLSTLALIGVPFYYENISFNLSMICFAVAILKFKFSSVAPVALQNVVDHMSDGFVVLDPDGSVIDFNKPYEDLFHGALTVERNAMFFEELERTRLVSAEKLETLSRCFNEVARSHTPVKLEETFRAGGAQRAVDVEIGAIFNGRMHIGTSILFKDVTERKQQIGLLQAKNQELDRVNAALAEQVAEVHRLNERLKTLAELDGLTGIYNRRFFNEYFEIEMKRALNQSQQPAAGEKHDMNFGIAILDVDNFKSINDTFGHLVGDRVLQQVVGVIKETVFSRDIVCRYGGEEFAVMFSKTPRAGAIQATEKIRERIAAHPFELSDTVKEGHVTVSIGFACFDDDCRTAHANILKLADDRLYQAKATGKNKVVSE